MKFRRAAIAVATAATLVLIPSTAMAGGNDYGPKDHWAKECRDGKQWRDYKYAPKCEPKKHDHRDKDRDKETPKPVRQSTYQGRVLKTN